MTWQERDHPRDPRTGEFRDKAGGWVDRVSDAVDQMRGFTRVRAADRQDELAGKVSGRVMSIIQHDDSYHGDPLLHDIAHEQGFDGHPEVVDAATMDTLIQTGQVVEAWRGLIEHQPSLGWSVPASELAEQYRTGDYFAGTGMFGNGIYFAVNKEYADTIPENGAEGAVLRVGIRTDARIVTREEMDTESEVFDTEDSFNLRGGAVDSMSPARLARATRDYILADPGRLAAARGIDVIHIARHSGDFYLVLNRTATVVQEADRG